MITLLGTPVYADDLFAVIFCFVIMPLALLYKKYNDKKLFEIVTRYIPEKFGEEYNKKYDDLEDLGRITTVVTIILVASIIFLFYLATTTEHTIENALWIM